MSRGETGSNSESKRLSKPRFRMSRSDPGEVRSIMFHAYAYAVFPSLQAPFECDKDAHVPQRHRGVFVKQALPLGDKIGDICRVFDVMLVPAAVQELPVVLDRDASHEHNHVPALDLLGRVDADDQVLLRAANLFLQLKKLLKSDIIYTVHRSLSS